MFEPVSAGDAATKRAFYGDEEFRRALRLEMSADGSDAGPVVRLRAAWDDTAVATCPGRPHWASKVITMAGFAPVMARITTPRVESGRVRRLRIS